MSLLWGRQYRLGIIDFKYSYCRQLSHVVQKQQLIVKQQLPEKGFMIRNQTLSSSSSSTKACIQRYHQIRSVYPTNRTWISRYSSSSSSTSSAGPGTTKARPTTVTGASSSEYGDTNKPFVIPAHTLTFTLLFIPCSIVAFYVMSTTNDEMVQQQVREKYGNNQQVMQKNQAMRDFFMNIEKGTDDQRLQQVLYGGKGEKKRLHAVDTELYGTEKGLEIKEQTVQKLQSDTEEKKIRKKERRRQLRRKLEEEKQEEDEKNQTPSLSTRLHTAITSIDKETIKTVATYTTIGTIAIVIGFFAGSSRRS